ncbi:MAG TPA: calcium-binding protein [Pirellulaceae bacterium]|nr:calcium-binding protein [Pirellulaceae bacterium]
MVAVLQRRLFLEPLESRDLLSALAVPTNSAIFDTSSAAPNAETNNLLSELAAQGHSAVTFSDLSADSLTAALAETQAIIIPEQELGSLHAALSADAKTALAQFVSSGRGMIVLGSPSGRTEALLNGLFGFSLAAGPDPDGVSILKSEESDGTAFATAPFAIFSNIVEVTAFDISNPAALPPGTRLPYQYGSVAPVGLFPYGQGQIVYLGYDFDDPEGQNNTANWKTLLGVAIEQVAVAAATPTTSVELVGGDLVVRDLGANNDGFVLSADSQQWVITVDTGSFTAPAAIAGVTVSDKTVTIEKSLAATFTGRFVFDAGAGNDVLRVNLDDIDRQVQFDGGESAGDHDLLEVVSLAGIGSLTSAPDTIGGGTLDVGSDGDAEIFYTGVEPVDLTGVQAQELHFVVPAGMTTAELKDYLAPNDGLSQLAFNGAGPEDQFFRHPSQLLAVHTLGNSVVTLFALELPTSIPELLLDGAASDLFRLGSTHAILGSTSLTLVEATLDLNGQSPLINGLFGNGAITNSADTNSLLSIGTSGGGGDFSGVISDGWPASDPPLTTRQIGIIKAGAGSQRLAGMHAFSGPVDIQAGLLVLDGSLSPHSSVTVHGGATLAGSGSAQGTVVAAAGSTISPGLPSQTGTLAAENAVWLEDSNVAIKIGGTDPGSEYDQHLIGNSLSIDGATLAVSLIDGFVPTQQPPVAFTIVDNLGALPIDGAFAGLAEGAAVNVPGSPVPLFITYQGGDGNDIVLFAAAGLQIVGTSGDDTLVLRRQGPGAADSELEYSLNGGPFVPLSDVESLSIDMGAGSDLVTLDFVFGEPVPPDGLQIDGGDPSPGSPGDRLVLLGRGDGTKAVYRPGNAAGEQGTIELAGDGNGIVELAGLEAIDVTELAQVTLATQSAGSDLDLADAWMAATSGRGFTAHAALRISGSSGAETIVPLHVWSLGGLVIDTTAAQGNDLLTIVSAAEGHGIGDLRINTGAESGDRTVVGATNIAGNLVVDSGVILIGGQVTAGGSINAASHGLLRIDAPVTAQGPVTLATTDTIGLDADLAIDAAVSSVLSNLVLASADNAVIRGPLSAATTIHIAIDTVNTDPEGNTLFLQAALFAPGGATAAGNVDADRFEIEPQTGSTLLILGGSAAGGSASVDQNANSGNAAGDKLVLDMTTAGDGQTVLGPVVVDSVGGRATAQNTLPITYRGIQDLDLYDGGALTTAQQGDIYVRGTDLDERIYVTHDGAIENPRLRISVQGRMFPEDQPYFGPYIRGRSVIVYARGGRDVVDLGATPMRGEFHGESGDDYLAGAAFGDLLIGGPGNDTLLGGSQGGDDELWGDDFDPIPKDDQGQPIANPTAAQVMQNRDHWSRLSSPTDGHDKLSSAGGNDQLYGQGGDDQLHAGAGDDYVSGGSGNDRISGGAGNDRLYGNDGNDTMSGDGGHDLLSGGSGNDLLLGRLGNDVLLGGDGADQLRGNEGDDLLLAGLVLRGGASADSLVAGDAADQAMLALLVEWSTLAQLSGITHLDDGHLDWLYGDTGSDRFVGDGTSRNYDFVAGVDS